MKFAEADDGPVGDDEPTRALRADAARNRERILVAAGEVFAERGLDATLDDIAHHAGLGVGTVYRRFPGKEELVEALFVQALDKMVALAEEAAEMEDPWESLVWFLERATEMQSEDLGLRDVALHSGFGRVKVAAARERIVPAVHRLVERAQKSGRLRSDFVPTDVPIIELMVSSVADYTSTLAPDLWRRYLAIVLDGLVSERTGTRPLSPGPSHEVIETAMSCHRFRKG
jgi:AcrR family transcriptional regulator